MFEYIYLNTSNPVVESMQISFQVEDVGELHHALVKLWTYCIARITNSCEPCVASWTVDFTRIGNGVVSTVSRLFDKIGIVVHIDGTDSPCGPLSLFKSCVLMPECTHTIQFSIKGISTRNCNAAFRMNSGAVLS